MSSAETEMMFAISYGASRAPRSKRHCIYLLCLTTRCVWRKTKYTSISTVTTCRKYYKQIFFLAIANVCAFSCMNIIFITRKFITFFSLFKIPHTIWLWHRERVCVEMILICFVLLFFFHFSICEIRLTNNVKTANERRKENS